MFRFFFSQNYEARIDALQKQVEEQSMTMSMYSSYTPEDFNNEEDIFGRFACLRSCIILWLYLRACRGLIIHS